MKNNGLAVVVQFLALSGMVSCSRPVYVLPPAASQTRIAFVYQPTDDFYSTMAVPENQVGNQAVLSTGKWEDGHIALFSGSAKSITYLLNNRPTYTGKAVKKVFHNHTIHNILVRENEAKTQRTFVIDYAE